MTNWHALPYELKHSVLSYRIDWILRARVDDYFEGFKRYFLFYLGLSILDNPFLDRGDPLRGVCSLQGLLTVAPELRRDAARMIAKRLPVLCDKGLQVFRLKMAAHGVDCDDSSMQDYRKTAQKDLMKAVMRELPRWQRDASGRLRSIDL